MYFSFSGQNDLMFIKQSSFSLKIVPNLFFQTRQSHLKTNQGKQVNRYLEIRVSVIIDELPGLSSVTKSF